jgi:hypothetical protein
MLVRDVEFGEDPAPDVTGEREGVLGPLRDLAHDEGDFVGMGHRGIILVAPSAQVRHSQPLIDETRTHCDD